MTLALAAPTHAQYGRDPGSVSARATLRINLGSGQLWTNIQGTRVEEIPLDQRQGYDVFRYGGRYYAYDNDRWYMSPQESGDFVAIDDASVPDEFVNIPSDHWRNDPSRWRSRRHPTPQAPEPNVSGTLQIDLGNSPRWSGVPGTGVRELRQGGPPNYDVFAYGGDYYAYDNNRWYMSHRRDGGFVAIDDRSVPQEFTRIPRDHWRNDPSSWRDRRDRGGNGSSATLELNFGSRPHWTSIRGTRVRTIRPGEGPDYDVFNYGGRYYVYRNDRWYSSRNLDGQFYVIEDRAVPSAFWRIPRNRWRNYPSRWSNR
jgi:hypothetical protein